MQGGARARAVLLAGAFGLMGCRSHHPIGGLEVVGPTLNDNAVLGLSAAQVQEIWRTRLAQDGRFELPAPAKPLPSPDRLTLELSFTREEQRPERSGTFAEVSALITLRHRLGEVTERYDLYGYGEAKLRGQALADRQQALRTALTRALEDADAGLRDQLDAFQKSDAQLIRDLKSQGGPRLAAIRVLSERKNPAVVPALLERLKSSDAQEVRQAMGELVNVGDLRAVPALIDLMRGKDNGFSKEIIFAIGAIGGEEAQAYLYTVSEGHEQPEIRDAARQALAELDARRGRTHARDAVAQDAQTKGGSP